MYYPSEDASAIAPLGIDPAFRRDVLSGLARDVRAVPPRWFYDRRGSELFEQITMLPEYYLTRAEREILASKSGEIADIAGRGRAVVEFGSGSSAKTPLLLSAIAPSCYVPIDISGDFLRLSAASLRRDFPHLAISEVEADFTRPLMLPARLAAAPRLGFFPGSTIGNFAVREAVDLLRTFAATLGNDALLLIGIDRVKDRDVLIAAYDDAAGVTAEFNLNLLRRINRELRGSIPLDAFRHAIRWNDDESRIEMHLQAQRNVQFGIDGHIFSMAEGETIHTENSLKYTPGETKLLLRAGGWKPIADWSDRQAYFSLILAQASPD